MEPLQDNVKNVCRSCMETSTAMKSLHSQMEGDTRSLWEVLTFVTNIMVTEGDELPDKICDECFYNIQIADSVKRKCQKSQELLRSAKALNMKVKTEVTELFCVDCCVQFANVSEFSEHLECHQNPYQCSVCMLRYNKMDMLEFHLSVSHKRRKKEINKFECSKCEETFVCEGQDIFESHLKGCTENATKLAQDEDIHVSYSYCNSVDDEFYPDCKLEDSDNSGSYNQVKTKKINTKMHPCTQCEKKFATKKSFKQHMQRTHSAGRKELKCKTINKTGNRDSSNTILAKFLSGSRSTSKTEKVNIELEKVKNEFGTNTNVSVPYSCSLCERKFVKKSSYENHLKKHEAKASHTCFICKREFKHRAHLDNHVLSSHATEGFEGQEVNLKCDYCPNAFATQASLDIHLASHKEQKKHQCEFCDKGFNMLSTLKDHLRTHTGEKPFLCSTCGRGFTQKTNLKEHMRRHTGFKPFSCNSCDQSFVSKGELVAHMRKHTGAHPFVCSTCSASFTTSSSLVKHRRIHTGERPYLCGYCPMRFTALGTLKNHCRTHTGEKPYKCTFCDKGFAQKNDLVSHTRCHTGERPYTCSTCGQSFRQSSALKTHLKMHAIKEGAIADIPLRLQIHKKHASNVFALGDVSISSISPDVNSCADTTEDN